MLIRKQHLPFDQRWIAPVLAAFPRLGPRLARWESAAVGEEWRAVQPGAPVWICGMARSGSTVLLEMLNGLAQFTSHRYSDYPWLWTPYWWNHLRSRLPPPAAQKQERAHRDRIAINRDSPEAFEEVFWMHFFPGRHDPSLSQVLDSAAEAGEFASFFDEHQRKLLAVRGANRYLAKANYNLPRLGLLKHLYPQARFIIPVREPRAQVASLIKQDALFTRLDSEDPAVSAHLARIGHFEFGPHKRALNLGDDKETETITRLFAGGQLAEAYARQWVVQYGHALRRVRENPDLASACLWVSHDRLCADPCNELQRLGVHLGLGDNERQLLIERWAPNLCAPDYYLPNYTAGELESIDEHTGPLWQKLETWIKRPASSP